ncbi:unnamed protein product [Moneuplotes crassus]|uniref:Uncharacterized protein n=1 Tax=Euplotes crassus TaxID=5936 RepID=A0AAD1X895_EUPCR|nr:unnamed protein product [Moneuplotes crassus]
MPIIQTQVRRKKHDTSNSTYLSAINKRILRHQGKKLMPSFKLKNTNPRQLRYVKSPQKKQESPFAKKIRLPFSHSPQPSRLLSPVKSRNQKTATKANIKKIFRKLHKDIQATPIIRVNNASPTKSMGADDTTGGFTEKSSLFMTYNNVKTDSNTRYQSRLSSCKRDSEFTTGGNIEAIDSKMISTIWARFDAVVPERTRRSSKGKYSAFFESLPVDQQTIKKVEARIAPVQNSQMTSQKNSKRMSSLRPIMNSVIEGKERIKQPRLTNAFIQKDFLTPF